MAGLDPEAGEKRKKYTHTNKKKIKKQKIKIQTDIKL